MKTKILLSLLVCFVFFNSQSLAQSHPFPQIAKLGEAARRVSRGTVPAIVKMVRDGDLILAQAASTGNPVQANLARKLYEKAIKLSRVEHHLKRELRKTIRKLQRARQHVTPGSGRSSTSSIRQAESLLAAIRQRAAFANLKHGFIRRTLRLVNQRLRQVERKSPKDGKKILADIKRFEQLFPRAQQVAQKDGNGTWANLRRADNKYRRALVAKRSERFDVAQRLLKDAIRTLERILKIRRNQRDGTNEEPLPAGTGVPQSPAVAGGDNAPLANSCRRAIKDVENLRSTIVSAVTQSSVARALVGRADRLVTEARTLAGKKNYRDAIKKVSLADRLYKRAFQIGSGAETGNSTSQ